MCTSNLSDCQKEAYDVEMLYWQVQLAHYNFRYIYPPGSPPGQSSATHMVLGARRLVITPWKEARSCLDHIHMPSLHIRRAQGGTVIELVTSLTCGELTTTNIWRLDVWEDNARRRRRFFLEIGGCFNPCCAAQPRLKPP